MPIGLLLLDDDRFLEQFGPQTEQFEGSPAMRQFKRAGGYEIEGLLGILTGNRSSRSYKFFVVGAEFLEKMRIRFGQSAARGVAGGNKVVDVGGETIGSEFGLVGV